MDWLSQNWVWVLIGIAFVALHLFGHGHGGHGGHRQHDARRAGAKGRRLGDKQRGDHGSANHGR
ncbi:MAG: DUF2933 domain-containing protein [Hyphomicrobiaceae bacterium]